MADSSQTGISPALSSDWGRLSPHLIASFFAVKKAGSDGKSPIRWVRDSEQPIVLSPITDGNIEAVENWQSPFENMGPDQRLSTFSALVQAGGFSSLLDQLRRLIGDSATLAAAQKKASDLEGKSNLTKLNSTQVFTGMPPLKISVTAHFRAYRDPAKEVRAPMDQLMQWALPQKIVQDGVVARGLGGDFGLFPSETPQIIGLQYADMLFAPLVIESIPYPLTGPRSSDGVLTHASITLQLASLTAIDKPDWINARSSRNMANNFGFIR